MVMYQCKQCKTTFSDYQQAARCCPQVVLVDVITLPATQRSQTTHEADTGQPCPSRIFSGDYSRDMWQLINDAKTLEDLQSAMYMVCCRLQEFESRVGRTGQG